MKRYNFDTIPILASGFGVHANSMKSAWSKVYSLAKLYDYKGKLQFRDYMKCPKLNYSRRYECDICT